MRLTGGCQTPMSHNRRFADDAEPDHACGVCHCRSLSLALLQRAIAIGAAAPIRLHHIVMAKVTGVRDDQPVCPHVGSARRAYCLTNWAGG
jgi:hypothetical protein